MTRRLAAIAAFVVAAPACVRMPPPPLLRTGGLTRVHGTEITLAAGTTLGANLAASAGASERFGPVFAVVSRFGLGPKTDLGVEIYGLGARLDLGIRIAQGGIGVLLLDPSIGADLQLLAPTGDFGYALPSSVEPILTLPLVLDVHLGQAHLTLATSVVGTWSHDATVPAFDATVVRPPGFQVYPAVAVVFGRPVSPSLAAMLELDASYATDLNAGFVALTVGVMHQ